MLDLKFITQQTDKVIQSLIKRNQTDLSNKVEECVELDKERKTYIQKAELLKAKRNEASLLIAKAKKEKREEPQLMEEMKAVATQIKEIDEKLTLTQQKIEQHLLEIPNVLNEIVPNGKAAENNQEVRRWGEIKPKTFKLQSHDELGEKQGILSFKKAGEVTGARFVFLKGIAAQLEMALIHFMFNEHIKSGCEPILPPVIVNKDTLIGTGQLPKFADDVFHIEKYGFYLSPTAEVPVTNFYRNEILEGKDLPINFVAYSACFRSEAGSYGKDTKGLKRQHQFNKVELVTFSTDERSEEEHEKMLSRAEGILKKLELPYRVILLCGGDTGFSSQKTYDIEVWSPCQNAYMEISSVSNCTDFQARRANIRYRDKNGKVQFAHTLNGSGLAVGRTLLAIMENYQNEDGSFDIPNCLKKYLD